LAAVTIDLVVVEVDAGGDQHDEIAATTQSTTGQNGGHRGD
jgi:hypothetical protein